MVPFEGEYQHINVIITHFCVVAPAASNILTLKTLTLNANQGHGENGTSTIRLHMFENISDFFFRILAAR